MYCAHCGNKLDDDSRFCSECGKSTMRELTVAPSSGQSSSVSGAGSTLGVAALCLGLAAVFMPYFAAVFLTPAAFLFGLLAFSRGRKGLGTAGMLLAAVALVGIIYVSNEMGRLLKDPFAQTSLTDSQPPTVTISQYQRIRDGMTYAQVKTIIGAAGEELSRSDLQGSTTVMYSWSNSNGSNMSAMFQDGRLVTRTQFGLR